MAVQLASLTAKMQHSSLVTRIVSAVTRWLGVLLVLLLVLAASIPQAVADDVLEGSPVVRRNTLYRAGRQEIGGLFGTTLGDPYVRNLLPGVRYDLHLTDWLSIGADVLFGIPVETSAFADISSKVGKYNDTFTMEASHIGVLAMLRASVAPITGKAMLLDSLPVNYDIHLNLAPGFATTPGIKVAPGTTPPPSSSLAFGVGVGVRVFFSRVVAMTVDLNDVFLNRVLSVNRNSQVPGASWEDNLMVHAGVSFFVPPDLKRAD